MASNSNPNRRGCDLQMLETDVTVIGAGIAGLNVARELARHRLRIVVVDREVDVSGGSTKASSSRIHADYGAPGSRTAEYTIQGNTLFDELCHDLAVPFSRCGELFAAFEGEEGILEEIIQGARDNGAVPFRRLTRDETLALEPNLNPEITAGAFGPSGGLLCSFELAIALYENLVENGVVFKLGCVVTGVTVEPGRPTVPHTEGGDIRARYVVNATGLFVDYVAALMGAEGVISVAPQRGQAVILDRAAGSLVNRVVFDCGLGLVVPTVHGNLLLGTTKDEAEDKDRDVRSHGRWIARSGSA
jgi:glycerol-3-phosphate dehydrogenase